VGYGDKIAKFYLLADLDKIRVRYKSSTLQVSKGRSLSNTHFFLSSLGRLILAKKEKGLVHIWMNHQTIIFVDLGSAASANYPLCAYRMYAACIYLIV
jgi:hypothetical protein